MLKNVADIDASGNTADTLTTLRHSHSQLAKTWRADGSIKDYGDAKYFTRSPRLVRGITELSALLSELERQPRACLIRGRYVGDELAAQRDMPDPMREHDGFKPGYVRRALRYFDDQPLHTVLIEVDEFKPLIADPVTDPLTAIDEYVQTALPACFHGIAYHWQMSNSAGHAKNAGKLKVHLWFWLAQPLTSAQLKAWADAAGVALDPRVFNPVQVHYTSAPVFEDGVVDPVPVRSGRVHGLIGDEVALTIDEAILARAVSVAATPLTKPRMMADATDAAVQYLFDAGLVRQEFADKLGVHCPNEGEHSGDSGPTEAVYFPRGVGGRADPGFQCMHSHCEHINGALFLDLVGFTNVGDEFEQLPDLSAEEQAAQLLVRVRNAATPRAVVEYLRTLPRDEVLSQWAGLTKALAKDAAQEVVDEVHRLTGIGMRALNAALMDARAQDGRALRLAATKQRTAGRQQIEYRPEDRTEVAGQLEAAIVKASKPGEYVAFGGLLSHVALKPLPCTHLIDDENSTPPAVPQIEPLDDVAVLGKAEKVAAFFESRDGMPQLIGVPQSIIDILLKKKVHGAPTVTGLVTHPIVLPSGQILAQDGLHEPSGLFLSGASISDVRPYSRDEAAAALARLRAEFLDGFEFSDPLHADVAVAGLLTGVERRVLDMAPGLAVCAAAQSSGKTTLARRIHIALTGRDMPVSTFPENDEAEVQKRLLSMLLRSPSMVCFDNITDGTTFRSSAVAAAMTGPVLVQRVLGLSRDADCLTNVLLVVTGNNLALGPDEVTRWLVCRLAPKTSRPEERSFAHPDVVAHLLGIRASVLRDVVGIVAGFLASGQAPAPRTRFPRWDRMVRQPLMWAGGADMADAFKANADEAEHLGAYEALFTELQGLFGDDEFLPSAVAEKVNEFDTSDQQKRLQAALGALRVKDARSATSVGRALRSAVGRLSHVDIDGAQHTATIEAKKSKGLVYYSIAIVE